MAISRENLTFARENFAFARENFTSAREDFISARENSTWGRENLAYPLGEMAKTSAFFKNASDLGALAVMAHYSAWGGYTGRWDRCRLEVERGQLRADVGEELKEQHCFALVVVGHVVGLGHNNLLLVWVVRTLCKRNGVGRGVTGKILPFCGKILSSSGEILS